MYTEITTPITQLETDIYNQLVEDGVQPQDITFKDYMAETRCLQYSYWDPLPNWLSNSPIYDNLHNDSWYEEDCGVLHAYIIKENSK